MSTIKRTENSFFIGEDENHIEAEIHYVENENQLIVNHTYVSDELRGTGMGKDLVRKIVNYARSTDKKIVALCPFVKSVIQKNEEWHDVLS